MDCKRPRNHWCQCLFRRNGKRRRSFEYNCYYVNQWSYYPTLPIQSPSHSPRIVRLPTLDNLGMTYDTLSVSAKIIFWQLILDTLDQILRISAKRTYVVTTGHTGYYRTHFDTPWWTHHTGTRALDTIEELSPAFANGAQNDKGLWTEKKDNLFEQASLASFCPSGPKAVS